MKRALSIVSCLVLMVSAASGCLGSRSEPGDGGGVTAAADDGGEAGATAAESATDDPGDTAGASDHDAATAPGPDPQRQEEPFPPTPFLIDLGGPCVASAECVSGHCAMPCEGYGTCVAATCAADAECEIPGGDTTHCCVAGACEPVLGAACGDRSGTQGTLCGSGGQTDCQDGLRCLDTCLSTSFCAEACSADSECQALDPLLGCRDVVGGDLRCAPDPEAPYACALDPDCGVGGVCTLNVSWDGTEVIKMCKAPVGPGGIGASCESGVDCKSGFCFDTYCSGACSEDAHCACTPGTGCAGSLICLDVWFTLGEDLYDAESTCYPRVRCESNAECFTLTCAAWVEQDGWASVCQSPGFNQLPGGQACQGSSNCQSGVCHDSVCRDLCAQDDQCGAGDTCTPTVVPGSGDPEATLGLCLGG